MIFSVQVKDLAAAIKKAKLTISPNDTNVHLQNFALRADADGKLTIIATDLQLATICVIPAAVTKPGECTIPGMKFIEIVANTSGDNLELTLDDSGQGATIQTGSYKARLVALDFDDYPKIEDFDATAAIIHDREDMLSKLDRISFSVSDNEAKKNLLAVYCNGGFMQASDGVVTTVVEFDKKFQGILIPALAVKDLVRVLRAAAAKELMICSTPNFLLFKLGDDVFMTRLSSAQFPDVPKKIIEPTRDNKIIFATNRVKLKAAVNRVGVTSSDKNMAVCFDIRSTPTPLLVLTSSDQIGNSSSEELEAEYTGDNMVLYLNYTKVLDILSALKEDKVTFKLSGNRKVPIRIEEQTPSLFMTFLTRLSEQIVAAPTSPTKDVNTNENVDEI